MKKGDLIVILSLLLILIPILFGLTLINFNLKLKAARELQAEILSGQASQSGVAMAITVIGPPYLELTYPKNGTYLIEDGIPLEFESEGDYTWYNIDNQENITVSGNTFVNISGGVHTLYLFANNTYGIAQESISFTANSTKIKIIMDNFNEDYEVSDETHPENRKKDKKGETTQIFDYTLEEIQNLDNFILDDDLNGKIEFNEPVNLTDNIEFSNRLINFTEAVNVSYNYIEINSTYFPGLERFATLTLRDLTFNNPRILKDGEICSEIECIIVNYSRGDLTFMVNGFSAYSAEDTPNETQPPSGGGGGGGGSILPWIKSNIYLDSEQISLKIKQGETSFKQINITNKGKQKLTITLDTSSNLRNFLKIEESTIILNPGESRLISLDFFVRENTSPGMYLGKIILNPGTNSLEKVIIVGLEVITKNPLFDVRIYVPEKYLQVMPGDEIYYSVEIFNLGEIEDEVDLEVEYSLINDKGETVTSHHESMAVRTKLSYIRHKEIPDHLPLGNYVIYLKVLYAGQVSSTSQMITIGPSSEIETPFPRFIYIVPTIVSIIAMVILMLLFWILLKLNKKDRFKEMILKNSERSGYYRF